MKSTKMAALVLAGMTLVGMTYSVAGQKAFAHSFSEDESATFLVNIWAAKVHLMLVGKNLANPEAALAHIDHVHMIIDDEMLNEIAERNERIAEDIPAALDELGLMIEDGEDRSVIVSQFNEISNLLSEAISVRIDREHISDPHIQALIVAGLADNALMSYEQAYGLGEHMMEDGHAMEESHEQAGDMVDHDAYVAAKAFATLAKNTFIRERLVSQGNEMAHEVQEGLMELRQALYAKHSVEDVTVAVHIGVHEKLQHAFDLDIAGHAASDDHSDEEGTDDHMDDGSMEESDHMEG